MTKIGILFILLITAVVGLNNESEAKMLNKFKEGFYFEKYKTEEEVKEVLLKLHPVGSNLKKLVDTLERAGAGKYSPKISKKHQKNPKLNYMLWYKYDHMTLTSIYTKSWSLSIQYNKNNEIISISVGVYQGT